MGAVYGIWERSHGGEGGGGRAWCIYIYIYRMVRPSGTTFFSDRETPTAISKPYRNFSVFSVVYFATSNVIYPLGI